VYQPDFKRFCRLAGKGNVVPVYRQLLSDSLTPVLAFSRLARKKGHAFLLESVIGGEKVARFSFLGCEPHLIFSARRNKTSVQKGKEVSREEMVENPFLKLREILSSYRSVHIEELPRFCGGAVGYAGYDAVRYLEHLPDVPPDRLGLADLSFAIYDSMLIFDHINKTVKVVVNARVDGGSLRTAYRRATERIDELSGRLAKRSALAPRGISPGGEVRLRYSSNFRKADFLKAVEKCKNYIRAGDIIQVVLSQRLAVPTTADPYDIYRTLRVVNPSPYMFYLRADDVHLIGSSPEVMVRLEGNLITLRPIAGTRPRGRTKEEDLALEKELHADPKERAEHVMLVDLGRNDVGRVSRYGSVVVDEVMVTERYSHVMHITSNITGRIRKGKDAIDVLMACIPAGTVTGAPKIRAMQIIDELEPEKRGPYAGAVGYIDFSGNMDTCITIRTIILKAGRAFVQVGAGIVADSIPEREYQETLNKAKGPLKAIELAENGLRER